MSFETMRDWAWEWPDQIRGALRQADAEGWPGDPAIPTGGRDGITAPRPAFVGAMGGSAASARFARRLLAEDLRGPVEVLADPHLPAWVGPGVDAGLISYSGQTWESLALWDQMESRGVRPWMITSGGQMRAEALRVSAPLFEVPAGYAPRAALGWMLVPTVLALASTGPDRARVRDSLSAAADQIESEIALWKQGQGNPERNPFELAPRLAGSRVCALTSDARNEAVAYRWKTQIEENAKQQAATVPFPDAAHNEIEGWGRPTGTNAGGSAPVTLLALDMNEASDQPASAVDRRVRVGRDAAWEAALEHAERRGLAVLRVAPFGEDPWTQVLSHVALADFTSLLVAQELGLDPLPVDILSSVKDRVRSAFREAGAERPESG